MTKSKKLKKWQVVLIVILLVAVALFAGLKVFKKQVLSAVLNDKELAAYDCCKKSNRVYDSLGVKNHITKIEYCKDNDDIFRVLVDGKSQDAITQSFGSYFLDSFKEVNIDFWVGNTTSKNNEFPKVSIDCLYDKEDLYTPDEDFYSVFGNKDNSIAIRFEKIGDNCPEYTLVDYLDDNNNVKIYSVPFYKIWIINL